MGLRAEFESLWREGSTLTRMSLVAFAGCAVQHLFALGGVTGGDDWWVPPLSAFVVIPLGWVMCGRAFVTHFRAWRAGVPRQSLRSSVGRLPWVLFVLLGAYMGAWMVYSVRQDGSPELRDGGPVWVSNNGVVRSMRWTEYHRASADVVVALSAEWCWFALVIAISNRNMDGHRRQIHEACTLRAA